MTFQKETKMKFVSKGTKEEPAQEKAQEKDVESNKVEFKKIPLYKYVLLILFVILLIILLLIMLCATAFQIYFVYRCVVDYRVCNLLFPF